MRRPPALLVAIVASLLLAGSTASTAPGDEGGFVRVQVTDDIESRDGVAFVVHHERQNGRTVVYLATSARLFDGHAGVHARVRLDDQQTLDISSDGIFVPDDPQQAAILRLVVDGPAPPTMAVVFDQVSAGTVFVVRGYGRSGSQVLATEQVGSVATRMIRGDRPLASLTDCIGAPAIGERGVFGVIAACEPDQPPVVSPLSASRSFIEWHVPGLVASPSAAPQFVLSEREFAGPTLQAPYGAVSRGEVEVPIALGANEALVGASVSLVRRTELRVAEVTVVSLNDRAVKLRFTIGNDPPPAQTAPWPVAQALVTLRVNLITLLKP